MATIRKGRSQAVAVCCMALQACGGGGGSINTPPGDTDDDTGIALQPVFDDLAFSSPVALLQAPGDDSRWFVVEQAGVVRVFDARTGVDTSGIFADISDEVDDSASEAGLLGMAFHPDFELNGQVFLSYTRSGAPLESVVSRFTVSGNDATLDESSEQIVLTVPQDAGNHNGGNLVFGADDLLYVGLGDGGGSGDPNDRGQDTSNLYGSIARIDVNGTLPYEIPGGNPFSGNTECMQGTGSAPCPEIFAWGFRNPWRFSFDRQSAQLWVGDVGQGDWEEIDRVDAGMNYGWRQREGAHCFNPSSDCSLQNVDPIAEYDHGLGQSVTGGYVYRGSAVPELVGHYLFGDFVSGRLFSVPASSPQGTAPVERLDSDLGISSFGEGVDGELYLLDYSSGTIYQIVATP